MSWQDFRERPESPVSGATISCAPKISNAFYCSVAFWSWLSGHSQYAWPGVQSCHKSAMQATPGLNMSFSFRHVPAVH